MVYSGYHAHSGELMIPKGARSGLAGRQGSCLQETTVDVVGKHLVNQDEVVCMLQPPMLIHANARLRSVCKLCPSSVATVNWWTNTTGTFSCGHAPITATSVYAPSAVP